MSKALVPSSFYVGDGPYPAGGYKIPQKGHRLDVATEHSYQFCAKSSTLKLGRVENGEFVQLASGTPVPKTEVTLWKWE